MPASIRETIGHANDQSDGASAVTYYRRYFGDVLKRLGRRA